MSVETAVLERLGESSDIGATVSRAVGLPGGDEDWPAFWVRTQDQRPFDRTSTGFSQLESEVMVGWVVDEGEEEALDTYRDATINQLDHYEGTNDGVDILWAELLGGAETDVEFERRGLVSGLLFRVVSEA